MRRVIYAWNYVEWGGAQIHFLALIKAARHDFEVMVVLPKGTDRQFLLLLEKNSVQYTEFEPAVDLRPALRTVDKVSRRWRRLKSESRMISKIRELRTDETIVHTDILPTQSLVSLLRLSRQMEVFITSHNALPAVSAIRWYWMQFKFLALSVGRIHVLCTNKHAARYFKKLYAASIADQIKITYDSIDPEEIEQARHADFDRERILNGLNVDPRKFIVLAVGQFIDRKGRWIFLEAAKTLAARNEDVHFVWLTPSDPDEADRDRVAAYGISDRFHLVTADKIGKNRDDAIRFFRVGDVFALPSFVEGLPISLLEAMALGLPAISTNVYGIPEAIRDGETGLLIEQGDPAALADAILRLKDDPALRCRLAHAGREHVLRSFDEREAARIAVAEYKRVFD